MHLQIIKNGIAQQCGSSTRSRATSFARSVHRQDVARMRRVLAVSSLTATVTLLRHSGQPMDPWNPAGCPGSRFNEQVGPHDLVPSATV